MKKIIFLFVILCSFKNFATHNRSAEILYKRVAPFSSYTYSITVIRYTDNGTGIADRCEDTVYFGDGQKAAVQRSNGTVGFCGCSGPCGEILISEAGYMVKKNIYSIIHTYSVAGTYIVSSTDINRNAGIINIPNSVNVPFYVESIIYASPSVSTNSSPVLSNLPVDKGFVNVCYYHHPGAYDEDGDSLSYQITTCKSTGGQSIPGYTFPDAGTGGSFTINPVTGLLTWCVPQAQGEYNFAIIVKEWRKINCTGNYQLIGSVTRDMQTVISNGTQASITLNSVSDTCIVAGTSFSKNLSINTSGQTSLYLIGASANLVNSPFAAVSPSNAANSFNSTFSWNTACNNIKNNSYQVVYYAEQTNVKRQKFYKQFNLKIVPPAPVIVSVNNPTNHVILTWKKVNNCNIKGYNIYRKNGSNSWSHSYCETGVPAYSGFSLIGYNNSADTIYDDGYFTPVANGSTGNYIVTAVMNDCLESFADSIKTVSFIVGVKENNLAEFDLAIFPNPVLNELQVDLKAFVFEQIESSIYSIDGKIVKDQTDKNCKGILTIQTKELKPGIYFLHLRTEKGTLVKKLIKE